MISTETTSRPRDRLTLYLTLSLVVFIAYLGLRSHTFLGYLVHDDGLFLYAGQAWAGGEVPYRDFWDHKPPGIFFFHSLPLRLFPFSLWAVKLHLLLWLTACAVLLYALLRRFFHRSASFLGIAFFILYTSYFYTIRSGGLTEECALFWVILSYWLITRPKGKLWRNALYSGIALGLAIQFRQTYVFESLFPIGGLGYSMLRKQIFWRTGSGAIVTFCLGMILPEIIISSYFLLQGCWWSYLEASYLSNFSYVGERPDHTWNEIYSIFKESIFSTGPYLYTPLLAFIAMIWQRQEVRWLLLPLLLVFVGDLFSITLSGEYYSHYFVQGAVTFAFLLTFFFDGIEQRIKQIKALNYKNLLFSLATLILAIMTLYPAYTGLRNYISDYRFILEEVSTKERMYAMQQSVAEAAQQITSPEDRILLLGQRPNSVYFFAKRYAGSRYYHYSPIWKPKLRKALKDWQKEEFMQDLREYKPSLLLVDLRARDLRELAELNPDERSRLDFLPGFREYIIEHYVPFEEAIERAPEDWFWYGYRLIFLIRKDHTDEMKKRFLSSN